MVLVNSNFTGDLFRRAFPLSELELRLLYPVRADYDTYLPHMSCGVGERMLEDERKRGGAVHSVGRCVSRGRKSDIADQYSTSLRAGGESGRTKRERERERERRGGGGVDCGV